MLLFSRINRFVQIKELGAIQSNAGRSSFEAMQGFLGKLDVSEKRNINPVACFGRQIAKFAELSLEFTKAALSAFVKSKGLLVGIENNNALVAIDNKQISAGNACHEFTQTHYGGDLKCPRPDGRMDGAAPPSPAGGT